MPPLATLLNAQKQNHELVEASDYARQGIGKLMTEPYEVEHETIEEELYFSDIGPKAIIVSYSYKHNSYSRSVSDTILFGTVTRATARLSISCCIIIMYRVTSLFTCRVKAWFGDFCRRLECFSFINRITV